MLINRLNALALGWAMNIIIMATDFRHGGKIALCSMAAAYLAEHFFVAASFYKKGFLSKLSFIASIASIVLGAAALIIFIVNS